MLGDTPDVTEELGSEINVIFPIDAPPVEHKDTADLAQDARRGRRRDPAGRQQGPVDRPRQRPLPAYGRARHSSWPSTRSRLHFFDPESGLAIGHPEVPAVTASEAAAQSA